MPQVSAVFFDVGETLVDESSQFAAWADWLGVPRHTFSAVFGAVIASGQDHRETFRYFDPGFDLAAERARREAAGCGERFTEADLYPDARPCLAALKDRGLVVGIAANQPARSEEILRHLALPADVIATSAGWGAHKPSPAFFERLAEEAGCRPQETVYVGDRLDNDVVPALAAGLQAVWLLRGPWAYLQDRTGRAPAGAARITTLADLPGLLLPPGHGVGHGVP